MNKSICILLNNPIFNDYRVIKTIQSISKKMNVDLFYVDGDTSQDQLLFNRNVSLYSTKLKKTLFSKIIKHTLFTREFICLEKLIQDQKKTYDIVWANDLPTLLPASRVAKKNKAKLIYDSHEIYNETINQFFPKKSSFLKTIIFKSLETFMKVHGRFMERILIKKVDHFITVNESILNYFKSKFKIKNGIFIMNLPILESRNEHPYNFKAENQLLDNDFIVIYQGVLNEGRGLRALIESISLCSKRIKLIILGDGPLKNELIGICEKNEINQVLFYPKTSIASLPRYTSGADLGINLLENFNLSKKMASPNKLFEYIHSNIPVLCSNGLENNKVLSQFNIGKSCSLKPKEIASHIEEFSNQNFEIYNDGLEEAKKHYNWQNQEPKLFAILA